MTKTCSEPARVVMEEFSAGIFTQSMGDRNRVGIRLS
jgi:hypothetical protein